MAILSYNPLAPNSLGSQDLVLTDGVPAPVSTHSESEHVSTDSQSAHVSTQRGSLAQNIESIQQNKEEIQKLIGERNKIMDTSLDKETIDARLDYTKLDSNSINIQMILLSMVAIILLAILAYKIIN